MFAVPLVPVKVTAHEEFPVKEGYSVLIKIAEISWITELFTTN